MRLAIGLFVACALIAPALGGVLYVNESGAMPPTNGVTPGSSRGTAITANSDHGGPAPTGKGILMQNWKKQLGNSTFHELSESAALVRASDSCNLDIVVGSDEYSPDPWMVPGYAPFFPPPPWEPMGVWHSIRADGSYRWLQNTSSDEAASSPAVIDINGDGKDEVVGGTTSGRTLEVLDAATGNFIWTFPTPQVPDYSYMYGWHASPAVADIMPYIAGLEVVALHSATNTVYAFQGANDGVNDGVHFSDYVHDIYSPLNLWADLYDMGQLGSEGNDWDLLWFADLKSVGGEPYFWDYDMSSPAIADVNADGKLEVAVASQNGYVYVIEGQTGAFLSQYEIGDTIASVAVANVNDDPQQEIFIGTSDFQNGDPAFYAFHWNNQGSPPGLELMWKAGESGNQIESSASVGDVDGDGRLEVVYGTVGGSIEARDAITGALDWVTITDGPVISSPALASRRSVDRWEMTWPFFRGNVRRTGYLPGSGEELSIYIGSSDGRLYLLRGRDGSTIDTFSVDPEESIQSSPVLGDIDGNHRIEVQVLTLNDLNTSESHFWSIVDTLSYGTGATPCGDPVADFGWWPVKPVVGQTVQFTDLSYDTDGKLVAWDWDFDGEGISNLTNPTFAFSHGGTRPVTLVVTDDSGITARVTKNVEVQGGNTPPEVTITADPNPAMEGAEVTFGGYFDDPDWGDTHTAKWSFGDGWSTGSKFSPGPGPGNTHHVMDEITHAYGNQQSYTACLSVSDQAGGNDTACAIVVVDNVLPDVEVNGISTAVGEGSSFTLDGGVDDPSWNDTWEASWDFGYRDDMRGLGPVVQGDVLPPFGYPFAHHHVAPIEWTYGDDGVYPVTLTVKDNFGGTGSDTLDITVLNVPPTIQPFGPFTVNEGSRVFISTNASDPGSDDLTFTWTFEFGPTIENTYYSDGTGPDSVQSPGGIYPVFAEDSVSYAYDDDGIYTLDLTVTDDDGGASSYSSTITVLNVPPAIKEFGPFSAKEGDPFAAQATASDPGSDDLTFTWTFEYGPVLQDVYYNDGVGPDPAKSPWGTSPFAAEDVVTHTYGDNGRYEIALRVSDDDGGVATYETFVNVDNLPPTILRTNAFLLADITLRVAGEKWHDVVLRLFTDGNETGYARVVRYPGSPDDQSATLHDVEISLDKRFSVVAYYTPPDDPINGQILGANPAWITVFWENGMKTELKHTFNVKHNDTWIWKVENFSVFAVNQIIHLNATAIDPGSDDLTFTWDAGGGLVLTMIAFNDGTGADPYPSPYGVFPFEARSDITLVYGVAGTYTITLTVADDDGGSTTVFITMQVG